MSSEALWIEAPEQLLAAHERLRDGGFSVVSVVSGHSALDARVWLGQWARARGRYILLAPTSEPEAAAAAYDQRARQGSKSGGPILALTGSFAQTLGAALVFSRLRPKTAIAITSGIAEVVASLLDVSTPPELVAAALQGLVPVGAIQKKLLQNVADTRQSPFFRGACEGIIFYMLEARGTTRGRFQANARIPSGLSGRQHEVDLLCHSERLVIEIDGPEHNGQVRRDMDARKQGDLERQGYGVRRFSNQTVMDDPVGVWRIIAGHFKDNAKEVSQ